MSKDYRKFNISRPREEVLKNGETKTFWDTVGTLTIFTKEDGSENGLIELLAFDRKTIRLNAFPFKSREQAAPKSNNNSRPAEEDNYSQRDDFEEIKVENIPF